MKDIQDEIPDQYGSGVPGKLWDFIRRKDRSEDETPDSDPAPTVGFTDPGAPDLVYDTEDGSEQVTDPDDGPSSEQFTVPEYGSEQVTDPDGPSSDQVTGTEAGLLFDQVSEPGKGVLSDFSGSTIQGVDEYGQKIAPVSTTDNVFHITRHGPSCNNFGLGEKVKRGMLYKDFDPALTVYGIIQVLDYNRHWYHAQQLYYQSGFDFPPGGIPVRPNKIFVSNLYRTWMTAFLLYGVFIESDPAPIDRSPPATPPEIQVGQADGVRKKRTLTLIVSPYLKEASKSYSIRGNHPAPLNKILEGFDLFLDLLCSLKDDKMDDSYLVTKNLQTLTFVDHVVISIPDYCGSDNYRSIVWSYFADDVGGTRTGYFIRESTPSPCEAVPLARVLDGTIKDEDEDEASPVAEYALRPSNKSSDENLVMQVRQGELDPSMLDIVVKTMQGDLDYAKTDENACIQDTIGETINESSNMSSWRQGLRKFRLGNHTGTYIINKVSTSNARQPLPFEEVNDLKNLVGEKITLKGTPQDTFEIVKNTNKTYDKDTICDPRFTDDGNISRFMGWASEFVQKPYYLSGLLAENSFPFTGTDKKIITVVSHRDQMVKYLKKYITTEVSGEELLNDVYAKNVYESNCWSFYTRSESTQLVKNKYPVFYLYNKIRLTNKAGILPDAVHPTPDSLKKAAEHFKREGLGKKNLDVKLFIDVVEKGDAQNTQLIFGIEKTKDGDRSHTDTEVENPYGSLCAQGRWRSASVERGGQVPSRVAEKRMLHDQQLFIKYDPYLPNLMQVEEILLFTAGRGPKWARSVTEENTFETRLKHVRLYYLATTHKADQAQWGELNKYIHDEVQKLFNMFLRKERKDGIERTKDEDAKSPMALQFYFILHEGEGVEQFLNEKAIWVHGWDEERSTLHGSTRGKGTSVMEEQMNLRNGAEPTHEEGHGMMDNLEILDKILFPKIHIQSYDDTDGQKYTVNYVLEEEGWVNNFAGTPFVITPRAAPDPGGSFSATNGGYYKVETIQKGDDALQNSPLALEIKARWQEDEDAKLQTVGGGKLRRRPSPSLNKKKTKRRKSIRRKPLRSKSRKKMTLKKSKQKKSIKKKYNSNKTVRRSSKKKSFSKRPAKNKSINKSKH